MQRFKLIKDRNKELDKELYKELNMLHRQLPINRRTTLPLQKFIGLREMFATQKTTVGGKR
jgi:hypothetical protein